MASSSPNSVLHEILTTFQSRLHSKIPLQLNSPADFRDEAKIRAVAKKEKQTAWKEFTKKLFNLHDPETDDEVNAVTEIMKEFVRERKNLIDNLIAKHKSFKETAENLVSKDIEHRCEKLKTSAEESLDKDPRMDVKDFFRRESVLVYGSFQMQWNRGNPVFFKEQKDKLMKKLEELKKEMVMKQKQRPENNQIILDHMSVGAEAVELAKTENENGNEGSKMDDVSELQSASMIVNTSSSTSFLQQSDEVIDSQGGEEESSTSTLSKAVPVITGKRKRKQPQSDDLSDQVRLESGTSARKRGHGRPPKITAVVEKGDITKQSKRSGESETRPGSSGKGKEDVNAKTQRKKATERKSTEGVVPAKSVEVKRAAETAPEKSTRQRVDAVALTSTKKPNYLRKGMMSKAGGTDFKVEYIIDQRMTEGKKEFLIKWKGLSMAQSTWKLAENLKCPKAKIRAYEEKVKKTEDQSEKGSASTSKPGEGVNEEIDSDEMKALVVSDSVVTEGGSRRGKGGSIPDHLYID